MIAHHAYDIIRGSNPVSLTITNLNTSYTHVRAGFLFHFPPIHFSSPFSFLILLSFILLLLPPTSLSAGSSLLSLFSSLLSSLIPPLRSGPILIGVCARRRCRCRHRRFTYSSSTRTLSLSSHLPTTCSTTWPRLPLSTSYLGLPDTHCTS